MNYTMKLTQQQAEALFNLLNLRIGGDPIDNLTDSLLKDIVLKVFLKLRSKLEAFPKNDYSVKLNAIEAKGFYLYWENNYIPDNQIYEKTLIQSKMNEIDKIYA